MTQAAIRVHAPRGISFARNKRTRRLLRSMDAALREAGLRPADRFDRQDDFAARAVLRDMLQPAAA